MSLRGKPRKARANSTTAYVTEIAAPLIMPAHSRLRLDGVRPGELPVRGQEVAPVAEGGHGVQDVADDGEADRAADRAQRRVGLRRQPERQPRGDQLGDEDERHDHQQARAARRRAASDAAGGQLAAGPSRRRPCPPPARPPAAAPSRPAEAQRDRRAWPQQPGPRHGGGQQIAQRGPARLARPRCPRRTARPARPAGSPRRRRGWTAAKFAAGGGGRVHQRQPCRSAPSGVPPIANATTSTNGSAASIAAHRPACAGAATAGRPPPGRGRRAAGPA